MAPSEIRVSRPGAPDDHAGWFPLQLHTTRTAFVLPTTNWTPQVILGQSNGIARCPRRHRKNRLHFMSLGTPTERTTSSGNIPSCIPADASKEIQDATAHSLMQEIQVAHVRTNLCAEPIATSYAQTGRGSRKDPVLLFIHSFDSNILEFRRIWPLLREASAISYAVDILGWGFTSKPTHLNYSVEEKREHLQAFLSQVVGSAPVTIVGASVGGAVAMDYSLAYPDEVSQLVLIGTPAFVNKKASPILERFRPLAALGASVLQASWLRRIAIRMNYTSRELKTEDTVRIGRLHTLTPGWQYAAERFIAGRGYCLAERVREIQCPVLVLYGERDAIVPSATNSERFRSELPNGCRSVAIKESGHSPHVEQAELTASEIFTWLFRDPGTL